MHAQKRNHVILINAVTRDADAADQGLASINGYAPWEYLNAVGELRCAALLLKKVVHIKARITGTAFGYVRDRAI